MQYDQRTEGQRTEQLLNSKPKQLFHIIKAESLEVCEHVTKTNHNDQEELKSQNENQRRDKCSHSWQTLIGVKSNVALSFVPMCEMVIHFIPRSSHSLSKIYPMNSKVGIVNTVKY